MNVYGCCLMILLTAPCSDNFIKTLRHLNTSQQLHVLDFTRLTRPLVVFTYHPVVPLAMFLPTQGLEQNSYNFKGFDVLRSLAHMTHKLCFPHSNTPPSKTSQEHRCICGHHMSSTFFNAWIAAQSMNFPMNHSCLYRQAFTDFTGAFS